MHGDSKPINQIETREVIKSGILGGWIGAVICALSTLPLGILVAVIIQSAIDDRYGSSDEFLASNAVLSLMGFGALCGGISGPIIAVMTMKSVNTPSS